MKHLRQLKIDLRTLYEDVRGISAAANGKASAA
jgi:hypothetical protein